MAVWVAPGNGFGEPNITLRRARMCRDAIQRGEITLKELANELNVEQTHFKRELNRLLTDAGERPIGAPTRLWKGKVTWDLGIRGDPTNGRRRRYIGERLNKCSLSEKVEEFIKSGGAITRIEKQTSVAA